MKRLLLSCTMFFCLAALLGATMRSSNSIGQDRGEWLHDDQYYLVQLPNQTQLHGPDGLVWAKQMFDGEQEQTVVTRYADGRADLIEVYQDAFLVRRQSGSAITYYQYSADGLLVQTTHVIDGRLQEARLYGYHKAALATILTVSDGQSNLRTFGMFKDHAYYAYSDAEGGQLFTTFAKGRTIGEYWIGEQKQEKLSVTTYEDGAFSILRKRGDEEILQQYDASGLLVSSKYPSYLVEYRYNENRVLIEERIIEAGGKITSKKYEEGKLVESTEEAGGRVVQSTRYNEDGSSVQSLYTEGRRYADVTYAVDGKRVLSITYY
jgi:hypothetical protein